MVLAVQAMEDQGPEVAVAAGVAAAATTVAVATPHGAAEDPRSTLLAIAVLGLDPKPLQCHLSGQLFGGAVDPFVFTVCTHHNKCFKFSPFFHEAYVLNVVFPSFSGHPLFPPLLFLFFYFLIMHF